jgi:hypothetical protein
MWNWIEPIIVLVAIAVAAALLACRAKKTLSGEEGCGCGHEKECPASALDSLFVEDGETDDDSTRTEES